MAQGSGAQSRESERKPPMGAAQPINLAMQYQAFTAQIQAVSTSYSSLTHHLRLLALRRLPPALALSPA